MSIHEMYESTTMSKVMDIAERNCEGCMRKCNNLRCPNMRALMQQGEKKIMTTEEKKRYFNLVGA